MNNKIMKKYPVEIEGLSIVFLGNFNPPILQPYWLCEKGLIHKTEADSASRSKDIVMAEPLTNFQGDWLKLTVTKERFAAATADRSCLHLLGDFVIGLFRLLEHTPVTRMGVNRNMHLGLRDESQLQSILNALAPKSPWEPVITKPALKGIMMQGDRTDGLSGVINIKIEPSNQISNGVLVDVNSDILPKEGNGIDYFVGVLEKNYDSIWEEAERIIHGLVSHMEKI